MHRSFRIRPARPDDTAALVTLGARRFADAHREAFAPTDLAALVERDWNEPRVANEIADPEVHVFVGVTAGQADDRPIGLCALRPGPIEGTRETAIELCRLYLEPDALGTGLGPALVDAVLEACDGGGHDRCWLLVGTTMTARPRSTSAAASRSGTNSRDGADAPSALLMIRPRPVPTR